MTSQVVLAVSFVLIVGMTVAWRTRNRVVRMVYVVPLWISAAVIVVVGGSAAVYLNRLRDFDQCIARVDRSVGNRTQTLQLYDTIDTATGTTKYTYSPLLPGEPSLREALNENLPPLHASDCEHP